MLAITQFLADMELDILSFSWCRQRDLNPRTTSATDPAGSEPAHHIRHGSGGI